MKVDEIRINAQLSVGMEIGSVAGRLYVIEAIREICNQYADAGKQVTENASISVENTTYALKETLLRLISINAMDSDYKLNSDNTITFYEPGSYEIKYFAMPQMPETIYSEVPLPQVFLSCIEHYLAYKVRARTFGQSDLNAIAFYRQYELQRDNANVQKSRQRIKRQIPARRGW